MNAHELSREEQAQQFRRQAAWLYELDEAIVRTIFEMQQRPYLSPRLHRALHEYAATTALRQLRVKVLAHLAAPRRRPYVPIRDDRAARDARQIDAFFRGDCS